MGLTRIKNINEPLFWKISKYYDNNLISKYDKDLQRICYEYDIKYILLCDILTLNDFIDGLHPNHNSHKKIYETVLHYINKV